VYFLFRVLLATLQKINCQHATPRVADQRRWSNVL